MIVVWVSVNDTNDCAQSDLVRIILNLAFLTKEDVTHMTFDPAGHTVEVGEDRG